MAGLEISTLDDSMLNAESEMQVNDRDGAPIDGCFINYGSIDSDVYRHEFEKTQKKRMQQAVQGRIPSPKEILADDIRHLAAATRSWRGFTLEGVDWPCTFENAQALYRRAPHIREQGQRYINDRSNFLQDLPQP